MPEVTTILMVMGVPSAVTGLCFWAVQKNITKRDDKRDERERAKDKNEIMLIRSVGAAIALGEATACAIRDGRCNGDMNAALEYAQKIKHEQKDFMTEQGVKYLY